MPRKLTITLDDQIYDGLYATAGRGHISRFIETVMRPHVLKPDLQSLEEGYRRMAADEAREAEALTHRASKHSIGPTRTTETRRSGPAKRS